VQAVGVAIITLKIYQVAEWFSVCCLCCQKGPKFESWWSHFFFSSVSALNIFNMYPVESIWSPCGLSSWTLGRTENQVLVDSRYFYQFLMDSRWSPSELVAQCKVLSFADRITVSRVTGFSAYYLLHGVHPVLPFDLADATFLVDGFTSGLSSTDLLVLRMRQLERRKEDLEKAAQALKKARFKSKEEFEWKFRKRMRRDHYKPGELVLVRNSGEEMKMNRKTKPRYLGPYKVVRRD
jgi:hypothetical protein